jgi:hypothetical protein
VISEEESQEPRRVERKLLIRVIPAEMSSETELLPGGDDDIDLGDDIEDGYLSDWLTTSHTFSMLPNGSALVTVLVERLR